jgi:hypothetical protein
LCARIRLVGQIDFLQAIAVLLSQFEVFKLFRNFSLPFNQSFKLLIFGPDFFGKLFNYSVSIILNGLFLLSKFVLYDLEVSLEHLK